MKNKAHLPRTAGLRTLTDLTTDLTKAGIDPSRIQERAVMIAKVRAAGSKRKRNEDGMDVDGDGNSNDEDGDNWVSEGGEEDETMMDVDGDGDEGEEEDGTRHKRGKANSGAAIAVRKRVPRSNRQLAGMRDEAVRCCHTQPHHPLSPRRVLIRVFFSFFLQQISKATRLRNLGQRGRNMLAKAGESDRAIRVKMVRLHLFFSILEISPFLFILGCWTLGVGALTFFSFLFFHLRRQHDILFFFFLHFYMFFFSRSISLLGSARQARPTADRHISRGLGGSIQLQYILASITLFCCCTFAISIS